MWFVASTAHVTYAVFDDEHVGVADPSYVYVFDPAVGYVNALLASVNVIVAFFFVIATVPEPV